MKKTKTKIASALLTAVMAVSAYATPCFAAEDRLELTERTLDGKDRTGWVYDMGQDSIIAAVLRGSFIGTGRYGDCNFDGKISAVDATLIIRYIMAPDKYGREVLDYKEPDNGAYKYYFYMDVNSDGKINVADVVLVSNYSLLHS